VLSVGKAATFSAVIRFDQIPDGLKQMAVSQVEGELEKHKHQEIQGETKVQTEIRHKVNDVTAKQLTSLIKDAGELAVSFDINRKANRLKGEMTFTGKPGSNLSKEIADVDKTQSLFGGLMSSNAAYNFLIHAVVPEEFRNIMGSAIDEGVKEAL